LLDLQIYEFKFGNSQIRQSENSSTIPFMSEKKTVRLTQTVKAAG